MDGDALLFFACVNRMEGSCVKKKVPRKRRMDGKDGVLPSRARYSLLWTNRSGDRFIGMTSSRVGVAML